MKLKLFIIYVMCAINLSAQNNSHLTIYELCGEEMNDWSHSIAKLFFDALEGGYTSRMTPFFTDELKITTPQLDFYKKEIAKRSPGFLYFRSKKDNYSYQRFYMNRYEGKRDYLLQIELRMRKDNPLIIEEVLFSRKVKLPKNIRKTIKKLDDDRISREEKNEIASKLFPYSFPSSYQLFEIDKGKIFLSYNSNYISTTSNCEFLTPEVMNKTRISIKFVAAGMDSIQLPPVLKEFENFEYLSIRGGSEFREIPNEIFDYSSLQTLILQFRSKYHLRISNRIKNLTKLKELEIYSKSTVYLPPEIESLQDLEKFIIKGNLLNNETLYLINRIKAKIDDKGK